SRVSGRPGDSAVLNPGGKIMGFIFKNNRLVKYHPEDDETVVIIPDNVTRIDSSVFQNCTNLKKVILPKNLKEIPTFCFENCKNLQEIIIPEGVEAIDSCAFENCICLKNIILPKNIQSIMYHAFWNCSSLQELTLPDDVKQVTSRIVPNGTLIRYRDLSFRVSEIENKVIFYFKLCTITKDPWRFATHLIDYEIPDILVQILDHGYLKQEDMLDLIQYANENEKYEMQMLLTRYKFEHFSDDSENPENSDRFVL
ncbi:MAG: leucine-rich repeat domain-containing protein, partial [Oscillospiraceae bacterium]|nr:leucine-rich repeat domain-containing protein [Oscillospiraceae bacterium]